MPFCPNCRKEYEPGTERCEDCGAPLVDSFRPAGPPGEDNEELVELAEFQNFPEAEMIQELLEGNGIGTVLRGEADPIGVASGAAPSTILVSRADLARARVIFEDFFAAEGDEDDRQLQESEPDEEEGDPEGR